MDLAAFVTRHPPSPPSRQPDNDDQLRLLTHEDGVRLLESPPAETDERNVPGRGGSLDKGRHLWVFRAVDVPYVLEGTPGVRKPLASGVAKHTNLTGGEPASCGGELWIDPADDGMLYVNGASGRYGPETPQKLADAVTVFENRGFSVTTFGWDDDTDRPARVLRA